MNCVCKVAFSLLLLTSFAGAQQNHDKGGFDPNMDECRALAKKADDQNLLRSHSASELNQLDWRLGVCVGKYEPLNPSGVPLILAAHGNVADELRARMERAIKTLPIEEQAKVWAAFNLDKGVTQ